MSAPRSLVDLVEQGAIAARHQGATSPALDDGVTTMTYADLLDFGRTMADELAAVGVGAESVVALDLEPGMRTVGAMIAAGLRGAAFMPIDAREPTARRDAMVAAARPVAVVTTDGVMPAHAGRTLDARLPVRVGASAYVSFTSGSSGVPKAVVTEQPAIVNYIEQAGAAYGLGPGDRQLQFSSIAFDIAMDEIFTTLAAGATLVHRGADFVFGGVVDFLERCRERRITVLNLPTGLWNRFGAELAAEPGLRLPDALRLVVVGGEAAQPGAVDGWQNAAVHRDFTMYNAYGPTEAAVSVSMARLEAGRRVTIGRALPGADLTLMDEHGREVVDGEQGEIVIGGLAVARGYLAPSTAGGFANIDGVWSYRTGDLARALPSGELEFIGRVDTQTKVRGGYRVEPGEVAAVLQEQPGVRQAHVMAHRRVDSAVLVAFVVPTSGESVDGLDVVALRTSIAAALPEWMIPWRVQAVDSIPLTHRGKADEAALRALLGTEDEPAPQRGGPGSAETPGPDIRAAVVASWQDALGVAPGSDEESFFEAGGDSVSALELIGGLDRRLGRSPAMLAFFRQPTVAGLMTWLTPDDASPQIPTAHHTTGRTLVRLRRSGSGRLWCFLPPLSGAVTRYAGMATQLPAGDAVWAMETPATLSDGGMTTLADGLARRVLDEGDHDLTRFDSVVFSGYSLGGVFAHEVARRVERALAGREDRAPVVSALLLDPPDPADPHLTLDEAFDIFVRVGWRIDEPVDSFLSDDGFDLVSVAAAARRGGSLPASAADDEVIDAWTVYASNARILDDYVLDSGVERTRVLRCHPDRDGVAGMWKAGEHDGSWAKVLAPGCTSLIDVEHFALMEPPNDRTVVRWLVDAATTTAAR